jgi:predicted XRE-type DNA-binding protein
MTKGTKMVRGSRNVFRDLGFREPEARNLALRSEVMIRIEEYVARSGMTQAKIDQFSLDALVNAAARAGLQVDLLVTTPKRTSARAVASA